MVYKEVKVKHTLITIHIEEEKPLIFKKLTLLYKTKEE
jgi:hypothetical protein